MLIAELKSQTFRKRPVRVLLAEITTQGVVQPDHRGGQYMLHVQKEVLTLSLLTVANSCLPQSGI